MLIPTMRLPRIACSLATLTLTQGALKSFKIMLRRYVQPSAFKQVEWRWPALRFRWRTDVGIIQRVGDVVALAGQVVGQADVQIDLYRLRHSPPVIYADECVDFEFAQEDCVHCCCVKSRNRRKIRAFNILRYSRC